MKNKGVLAFVDVVDFTPQAVGQGDELTGKFEYDFETRMRERAEKKNGHFIKRQGDGVLLYFPDEEDFLPFAFGVRVDSGRGGLDCHGFECRVRIVGHYGKFNLVRGGEENETITDVSGAEAIVVFRMEKLAKPLEICITDYLLNLVKTQLREHGVNFRKVTAKEKRLKGFDKEIPVYRLIFPTTEQIEKTLLGKLMAELETKTRFIPVFGDIYPAMSMENNFVDLDMDTESDDDLHLNEKSRQKQLERMDHEWQHADSYFLDPDKKRRPFMKKGNVKEIYENHYRGLIFGLPGSGKTTILKYFAFRDFKRNREQAEGGPSRVVVLVECRSLKSYNGWRGQPGRGERHSMEWMLKWLAHGFLFPGGEPGKEEPAQVEAAETAVKKAFYQGCLTLLVDALDEAPDMEVKDDVLAALRLLCAESNEGKKQTNRVFLTARVFEKEHILATDPEGILQPVFDVRSLDLSQIREMAKHFYRKQPGLYNAFDDMVWKEEIPARIGGTPLTALLVIVYYESFESLDNRYHMYHVLLTFILGRTWKRIKDGDFKMDMKAFFKEAHSGRLLKADPDAERLYDALSLLSFGYMDLGRVLNKRDILKVLGSHKASPWGSETEYAEQLLDRLVEDHLLVPAGVGKLVFIHATVMEYLAARFLVKRWSESSFMADMYPENIFEKNLETKPRIFYETETLPIAIGSSIENGLRIMKYIKKRKQAVDREDKEIFYRLGVRALAEWESCVTRMREETRLIFLRLDADQLIEEQKHVVDWVYDYLITEVTGSDKEKLKNEAEEFQSVSKLSLPNFLDRLDFDVFCKGEIEVVQLREALLETVVRRDILEPWLTSHRNILREKEEAEAPIVIAGPEESEEIFFIEPLGSSALTYDSEGYDPDDKNFAYYRRISGPELIGISGSPNLRHCDGVTCVAVSPDHRHILSGSHDGRVRLWDKNTGKAVQEYKGHTREVTSVVFSPDGTVVASGSFDNTVILWETDTGNAIREFKGHTNIVNCVAFSRDGTVVASGSDDETVKLWDRDTGNTIRELKGHTGSVESIAFSPDGTSFASGSLDNTVILWEPDTGNAIREFKGHTNTVNGVAFSPDGTAVASGSYDHIVKLWDCATGKTIREFKEHTGTVRCVAFSPDGTAVASGSLDQTVKLWDRATGKAIREFKGHTDWIHSVAFSPDGITVASGSIDKSVKLWDRATGNTLRDFKGHTNTVNCVAFSPDGTAVASGSYDHIVKLWDRASGKTIREFRGHTEAVLSVAFSLDGTTVASGSADRTVKLWDRNTGKTIREFKGHTDSLRCVAVSPDGTTVASGSLDKSVKLWDRDTGKTIREFKGHEKWVYCVAFSPNGTAVASGAGDNTVKLWDRDTCNTTREFKGHTDRVRCVAFSPDGAAVISGSKDHTLKIWNTQTSECIKTIPLAWIPDEIHPLPGNEGIYATLNFNRTITFFDLRKYF